MSFDWQTISIVVSSLVALFGVGLSVYTLYAQRRDKRPRLKVTATEDIAVTTRMQGTLLLGVAMRRNDAGKPDGAGEPVVCLELANLGEKIARVVEVRMVQPSGAYMILGSMGAERPFPPVIEPGDSTRCWIGLGKVTDILRTRGVTGKVRLRFEVNDALGYVHKDEMVIDTEEWVPYSTFFSEQVLRSPKQPDAARRG
jgi:hypothetical protein